MNNYRARISGYKTDTLENSGQDVRDTVSPKAEPPRLGSIAKRASMVLSYGGIGHLVDRILHKLTLPVFEFGSCVFITVDLSVIESSSKRAACVTTHQAGLLDVHQVLEASDSSRTVEQLRDRFLRGDRCYFAADSDGNIVHTRWSADKRAYIEELDLAVILRNGEVYAYDTYTRPKWRGLGVDGIAKRFMEATLRKAGFKRVFAFVRGNNLSALRSARFEEKIGRLRWIRVRGCRPVVIGRRGKNMPLLVNPHI